ncbi:hypothetical protein JOF46_003744 [Paeniglutamicibacter psychrophenolicus]|uniref:Secreted protein n=1 Tax=Paeniglutamicibacter psychrophenolicus TaxID=257454 RepID=A0ABS4WHZ4_9MICC|nr:hypothetical protein [Paeniglutamicibacter psychrophenolicus]
MSVSPLIWGITIAAIVALLAFGHFLHISQAFMAILREATSRSSTHVSFAPPLREPELPPSKETTCPGHRSRAKQARSRRRKATTSGTTNTRERGRGK